jgi:hypothetical protein
MAGTTSKVLAGCALGCLLAVLLVVGAGWMLVRWGQGMASTVEQARAESGELAERFGATADFVPAAGPGVPADRLELFLGVRESLAGPRQELEAAIAGFAPTAGAGGFVRGLGAARAGLSIAPKALDYIGARNRALLDAGMGLGEYTWLYWLVYHAWLEHPVDDSLLEELVTAHEAGDGATKMRFEGGPERERLVRRLRADVTAMLGNLEGRLAADPERPPLLGAVSSELAALAADPERLPFPDGLPAPLAAGLEPWRERLEGSYSKAANPFELYGFE